MRAAQTLEDIWHERTRQRVWYGSVGLLILGLISYSLAIFWRGLAWGTDLRTIEFVMSLRIFVCAYCISCLLYLLARKRTIQLRTLRIINVALYAMSGVVIWIAQSRALEASPPSLSFLGFHVGIILAVSLDLGSLALSASVLAGFIAEAAAFWFYYDLSARAPALLPTEPVVTIILSCVAAVIFESQRRYTLTNYRLLQAESRTAAMTEVAKTFLFVRDKVNTPLQTIEFGLEVLRRGDSDDDLILRMQRAQDQLTNLFKIFRSFERDERWKVDPRGFQKEFTSGHEGSRNLRNPP